MKKLLKISITIVIAIILISSAVLFYFAFLSPDNVQLSMEKLDFTNTKNIEIVDLNGQAIPIKTTQKYLTEEDLPDHIKHAFVAIEDKRFYKHNGIDFYRILGAAKYNLQSGEFSQGGSTITQQLIKNTHLSGKKKISRKINEAKLAIQVEKVLTKDEILTSYLNAIYFGNGIYGLRQAVEIYYGCKVQDLSIAQSATLAALVKSPSKLSEKNNFQACQTRRNLVLKAMYSEGYIDNRQLETATNEDTLLQRFSGDATAQTYYNAALTQAKQILELTDLEIANNYTIKTYYNAASQKAAEDAIKADNTKTVSNSDAQKCVIVANNYSHGVEGVYANCNTNIINMRRQMASTAKPLAVFAPAIDKGLIAPLTSILDEEKSWANYNPKNLNETYHGWVNVRYALQHSLNIPSVKILEQIGLETSKEYLTRNGFDIANDEKLSLALGTTQQGVTFLQLVQGYMTLANKGIFGKISLIHSISDKNGNIVFTHNAMPRRVFQEDTAFVVTDMLCDVVNYGTGQGAKTNGVSIAGKTGTGGANGKDNSDALFVSYTTENTTLSWLGGDGDQMLPQKTGGGTAAKMANILYKQLYASSAPAKFKIADGVKKVNIDKDSYETNREILITQEKTNVISDYFLERSMPPIYYQKTAKHMLCAEVSNGKVVVWINNPINCAYRVYRISSGLEQQIGLLQSNSKLIDNSAPSGETGYLAVPIDTNFAKTNEVVVQIPERKFHGFWDWIKQI